MSTLYYETLNQPNCWGVFVYLPEEVLRYVQLRYGKEAPNNRDRYCEAYPPIDNIYFVGHNIIEQILEFADSIGIHLVEITSPSKTPEEFNTIIQRIKNEAVS